MRHPVLRAGNPIESCEFKGDNLETTIHLGIYINSDIIGVCSFFKNSYDVLFDKNQYQLRGMAVLKKHQKTGLGRILINFGENLLQQKKVNVVWCNARKVAVNFYKNNGFDVISKPFHIANIGMHYTMYKSL